MAAIDWFWAWVDRHIERFPRCDWPAPDSAYWAEMRHMLVTSGADEAVADEASRRLFADPPGFPDAHPKAIRYQIRAVFRDARSLAPAPPDGREDHSAWNGLAADYWQSLTEAERDEWRALVYRRATFFARNEMARELLAQAWAYQPALVIDEPTAAPSAPVRRGPKHMFDNVAFVPFDQTKGC